MSIDLGLVTLTPQTGHCAASQALLKELLGKGLARRGVFGCVASAGQALWDWPASAPCQRPLGAATISEIYFGICSSRFQYPPSWRNPWNVAEYLSGPDHSGFMHQLPTNIERSTTRAISA